MDIKKLLAKYKVEEKGLKNLVDDLEKLPENSHRNTILKNALIGLYSEKDSSQDKPATLLQTHLEKAVTKTTFFNALLQNAQNGKYDHLHKPINLSDVNPHGFMSHSSTQKNATSQVNEPMCQI